RDAPRLRRSAREDRRQEARELRARNRAALSGRRSRARRRAERARKAPEALGRLVVLVAAAQTERASLLVEVAALETERARRGRHLTLMVRERFLDDLALGLFGE